MADIPASLVGSMKAKVKTNYYKYSAIGKAQNIKTKMNEELLLLLFVNELLNVSTDLCNLTLPLHSLQNILIKPLFCLSYILGKKADSFSLIFHFKSKL